MCQAKISYCTHIWAYLMPHDHFCLIKVIEIQQNYQLHYVKYYSPYKLILQHLSLFNNKCYHLGLFAFNPLINGVRLLILDQITPCFFGKPNYTFFTLVFHVDYIFPLELSKHAIKPPIFHPDYNVPLLVVLTFSLMKNVSTYTIYDFYTH